MHKTKHRSILEWIKTKIQVVALIVLTLGGGFVFVNGVIVGQAATETLESNGYSCTVNVDENTHTLEKCTLKNGTETTSIPLECIIFQIPNADTQFSCRPTYIRFTKGVNGDGNEVSRQMWKISQSFGGLDTEYNGGVAFYTQDNQIGIVTGAAAANLCVSGGAGGFVPFSDVCTVSSLNEFQEAAGVTVRSLSFTQSADDFVPDSVSISSLVLNDDGITYTGPGGRQFRRNDDGTYTDLTTNRTYNAQGQLQQTQEVTDLEDVPEPVGNGDSAFGNAAEFLIDLVVGILTVFVWAIGLLVQIVFWVIANIFLYIVRINPASSAFLEVATAPWNIVVNLANIVILGSFIFVGLGYIVGLDAVKKKKSTASDFLINIVIIAVTINFTLSATATFVNVIQGVGDLMYVSYVRRFGGEAGSDTVVNNLVGNLKETSKLQCEPGKSCNTTIENENGVFDPVREAFGAVFGEGSGVPIFLRQCLYVLIMVYAIFIFIKALRLALFRVVGLWLLMITSPLALVMYLSPVDGLKKQAYKWFSLFWQMSIFYPAFLFALIVINSLAGAFSNAAEAVANEQITGTLSGGVTANAAFVDSQDLIKVVLTILSAVVAVFTLQIVIDFFEKAFGEIAGAALNGVTGAIGQGLRFAGGAAGLAGRASGIVRDNRAQKNLTSLQSRLKEAKQSKPTDLDGQIKKQTTIASLKRDIAAQTAANKKRVEARQNSKLFKLSQSTEKNLKKAGDIVESSPELLNMAGDIPKGYIDNLKKGREARKARFISQVKGRTEAGIRKNGALYGALAATGYNMDADPNLNTFAGLKPEDIKNIEAKYKKDKEDPNASYLKDEISKRASDVYKKTLGVKDQYDREVKDILLDSLAEKIQKAGGDINALSDGDRTKARTLFNQSLSDAGLRSKILQDEGLTKLAQNTFGQLDPEAANIIQDKAPSLLPSKQERINAGARMATSPDALREADRDTLQNSDIQEGFLSVNGYDADGYRQLNERVKVNGYSQQGDQKAKNDGDVQELEESMMSIAGGDADKEKELENRFDNNARRIMTKGYSPENEIISRLAQIDSDPEIDDADKPAAKQAILNNADQRVFGEGVVRRDLDGKADFDVAALNNMSYADLAKTEIGQEVIKNGLDNYTTNDEEKAAVLRANIARAAVNNVANSETTQGKITAVSKKFNGAIEEKRGKTTILNTQMKALDDLTTQPDALQLLEDGDAAGGVGDKSTHRLLGMQKQFDRLEEAVLKDGQVELDGNTYDFTNMSTKDRQKMLGTMNKLVAGAVGGKDITKEIQAITDLGDDDARDLMQQQLINSGSEFSTKMADTGANISRELRDDIRKNSKDPNAPTQAEVNNVLRKRIADTKKTKTKKEDGVKKGVEKLKMGDIDQAMRGSDIDKYEVDTVTLGPGGGSGGGVPYSAEAVGDSNAAQGDSGFVPALNRNLERSVLIQDQAGQPVQATMEEVVRDYHSESPRFTYTPEVVQNQGLESFRVAESGQILSNRSATKAKYQAGNKAYAEAPRIESTGNIQEDYARGAEELLNFLDGGTVSAPQTVPYQTQAAPATTTSSTRPTTPPTSGNVSTVTAGGSKRVPVTQQAPVSLETKQKSLNAQRSRLERKEKNYLEAYGVESIQEIPEKQRPQVEQDLNSHRETITQLETEVANLQSSSSSTTSQPTSNSESIPTPQIENRDFVSEFRNRSQADANPTSGNRQTLSPSDLASAQRNIADRKTKRKNLQDLDQDTQQQKIQITEQSQAYNQAQQEVRREEVKLANDTEYQNLLQERERINRGEMNVSSAEYNPFTYEQDSSAREVEIDEKIANKRGEFDSAKYRASRAQDKLEYSQIRIANNQKERQKIQQELKPTAPATNAVDVAQREANYRQQIQNDAVVRERFESLSPQQQQEVLTDVRAGGKKARRQLEIERTQAAQAQQVAQDNLRAVTQEVQAFTTNKQGQPVQTVKGDTPAQQRANTARLEEARAEAAAAKNNYDNLQAQVETISTNSPTPEVVREQATRAKAANTTAPQGLATPEAQNIARYNSSRAVQSGQAPRFEELTDQTTKQTIAAGGRTSVSGQAKINIARQKAQTQLDQANQRVQELNSKRVQARKAGEDTSRIESQLEAARRRQGDLQVQTQMQNAALNDRSQQLEATRQDRQDQRVNQQLTNQKAANTTPQGIRVSRQQSAEANIRAYNASRAVQSGKAPKYESIQDQKTKQNIATGGRASEAERRRQTATAKQVAAVDTQAAAQAQTAYENAAQTVNATYGPVTPEARQNLEQLDRRRQQAQAQATQSQQNLQQAKQVQKEEYHNRSRARFDSAPAARTSAQGSSANRPNNPEPVLPSTAGLNVTASEIKQRVSTYEAKARDNRKMKAFNELDEAQKRDIIQGGRQSIGVLEAQAENLQNRIDAYEEANAQINQTVTQAQEQLNQPVKGKGLPFVGAKKKQLNNAAQAQNTYTQAAAQAQKAAQTPLSQDSSAKPNKIAPLIQAEKEIRQNYESVSRRATHSSEKLAKVQEDGYVDNNMNKASVDMRAQDIREVQSQNEALLNQTKQYQAEQKDEIARRKASRTPANNPSPTMVTPNQAAQTKGDNIQRSGMVDVEQAVNSAADKITSTQSNDTRPPRTSQPRTIVRPVDNQDLNRFAQTNNLEDLATGNLTADRVQNIQNNTGLSSEEATKVVFAEQYLNVDSTQRQSVNQGVLNKLQQQDTSGMLANQFNELLRKSQNNSLTPQDKIALTNLLSQ